MLRRCPGVVIGLYSFLVALGFMWAQIAKAALQKNADANGGDGCARASARLVTGRFFMERMLPETATHLKRIQAGATTTMELPAEAF